MTRLVGIQIVQVKFNVQEAEQMWEDVTKLDVPEGLGWKTFGLDFTARYVRLLCRSNHGGGSIAITQVKFS